VFGQFSVDIHCRYRSRLARIIMDPATSGGPMVMGFYQATTTHHFLHFNG
jgi:hypothetical protein